MSITIPVALGARSYDIVIAEGLLEEAGARIAALGGKRPVAVVTDSNVAAHHLQPLLAALNAAGIAATPIVLEPGEQTKSWPVLEKLLDRLLDLGVERGDHVVALGGGVIGDLTGFAASIMKRGCGFVQIPTSLLAQVDSSVGGKTAINTAAGKNLVGTFHQPSLVLIDPAVLATLPPRELGAGYAEIVKYGLIDDPEFFAWCEANGPALLAGDRALQAEAIAASVRAKARVVADDERETKGSRALLNLGHTFGHALEADTGFSDRLLHGEAVAIGMLLAFRFSAEEGLCPAGIPARVDAHFNACALPRHPREVGITGPASALVAHMAQDKKMEGGRLPFVLARGIGGAFLDKRVDLKRVEAFLARVLAER